MKSLVDFINERGPAPMDRMNQDIADIFSAADFAKCNKMRIKDVLELDDEEAKKLIISLKEKYFEQIRRGEKHFEYRKSFKISYRFIKKSSPSLI